MGDNIFTEIGEKIEKTVSKTYRKIKGWYETVTSKVKKWKDRYLHTIKKFGYTIKTFFSDADYQPNDVDKELTERCQQYINIAFPKGLHHELSELPENERAEYLAKRCSEIAKIMGVNIDGVEFFAPETEDDLRMRGFYLKETNKIYINIAYIICLDSKEETDDMLRTIFHEFKHARQISALFNNIDYGYSKELLLEWAKNFKYYIQPYESDRAYRKQPIELDAYGWTYTLDIKDNVNL